MQKKLAIARLGRSVGLKGDIKLHILTDFPEQFKKGATFETDRGTFTIEHVNFGRGTIKFAGIDTPEDAKKLTNAYLYSDEETTRENIDLGEDEYFWFDIIGCELFDGDELLGKIVDIERLPAADYLVVQTAQKLAKEHAKRFLVPFQDRFIDDVDIKNKKVFAKGAKEILEAS